MSTMLRHIGQTQSRKKAIGGFEPGKEAVRKEGERRRKEKGTGGSTKRKQSWKRGKRRGDTRLAEAGDAGAENRGITEFTLSPDVCQEQLGASEKKRNNPGREKAEKLDTSGGNGVGSKRGRSKGTF